LERIVTLDELTQQILAIMPDAIVDEEYRSGEIMISTGLVLRDDKLEKIDAGIAY
jgi:hypothetical protein